MHLSALPVSLLLATALPAVAAADDSLRCAGGIVSLRDWKIDLLGKCGEPTLRDVTRSEELTLTREADAPTTPGIRATGTVERWTYDFGQGSFTAIVTIEAGRIRAIERGGRGHAEHPSGTPLRPVPVARCDYMTLRVGDRTYDLLARCGEPATRDVQLLERSVEIVERGSTLRRAVTVTLELWTYHFGPQTLVRILELEDGKVVRVETGSRGYPEL
jgi:hypothetical protein